MDSFKIIFFDVGQGDSVLIITPGGKIILIDGGPDDKILRHLGEALPFWKRNIDLLVITHTHDDHIVGLIPVSLRYKIKQVLYNNLNFKTPTLETLTSIFKSQQIIQTKSNSYQNQISSLHVLMSY
jgi:competence protein ComEC